MRNPTVPSVAIVGTRGYPSFYGGFETAVRHLAPALADAGWSVTVYGRPKGSTSAGVDERITVRTTRGPDTRSLGTPVHGLAAILDVARRRHDVCLIMNVANGLWLPILRFRGIPTVINVDGLEWLRGKWGRLARWVFRIGAKMTASYGTGLVYDAEAIANFWAVTYGRDGTFIPYGGTIPGSLPVPLELESGRYVLFVARLVPENSVREFFEAAELLSQKYMVVVVGSSGHGGAFDDAARGLAESNPNFRWLGHVRDDALLFSLWAHCGAYFHGHSVGGTNPALVQALACSAPTVCRDTPYNREVMGEGGIFCAPDAVEIAHAIGRVMEDPDLRDRLAQRGVQRVVDVYNWPSVCESYEKLLRSCL